MPICSDFCSFLTENVNAICESWDPGERKNCFAAFLSGVLFFTGWWFMIDAAARYPSSEDLPHAYHIVGVVATFAMFMVNSVSNGQVRGDAYTDGCLGPMGAKVWFFLGLTLSFSSLIASCWILFGNYIATGYVHLWPGVALFLQNFFIFFSSVAYKLGRSEDSWS